MKSSTLRIIIPLVILGIAGIAFIAHLELGTLSAVGWKDIAVICPIGALGTMLASKTILPRAVISLALTVIALILIGRAFCGWVCPVPVFSKIRDIAKSPAQRAKEKAAREGSGGVGVNADGITAIASVEATAAKADTAPLSESELKALQTACSHKPCHGGDAANNSRFVILSAGLLSAAIFGFPVFCLICPVGLSFAGVFTLIMLFGNGDVSLSVVLIPVILLVEIVFFRKWCSHICPISALMSLVSRFNKTLQPSIDNTKCLETATGHACGKCAQVCPQGIDVRHPELGEGAYECTKCRICIDSCPTHAISMPLLPKKNEAVTVRLLPGKNGGATKADQ